jgi:thymidylate synthase ThyX
MTQEHQVELLKPYITNLEDQVFAIKNLDGLVGAVMARYSRSETGLRETLLREFIVEDKLQLKKADKLIEKVLIAYGDDSVGELEGAHLALEGISMLATKVVEHRRIGGSPIEKSTRYVRFDQRDEHGHYRYVTPEGLDPGTEQDYHRMMDRIFDGYAGMWEPIHRYLKEIKPLSEAEYTMGGTVMHWSECKSTKRENAFMRTYENDLKTKTCDILRSFLPMATKANMGLFGNGRFFQNLISKMLSSPLAEARSLGEKSLEELSKIIPHYVKRAKRLDYQIQNDTAMRRFAAEFFPDTISGNSDNTPAESGVQSIELDYSEAFKRMNSVASPDELRRLILDQEEDSFLTALIFPYCAMPFELIRKRIQGLSRKRKEQLYRACYGKRKTRRDRPERIIEHGYPHQFELITEWAVYKDLMRHRMGTMLVQDLNPYLGFNMPVECEDARVLDAGEDIVKTSEQLFKILAERSPENKGYAFLHGHRLRWMIGMNDRALMHMLELRTTPQGHPNYRRISQEMHRLLLEKIPSRAEEMTFINHNPVFWSRAESEARLREKEEQFGGTL